MVICNNCGHQVPPGESFCRECGASLNFAAPAQVVPVPAPARGVNPLWLVVAVLGTLLVALAGAYLVFLPTSPTPNQNTAANPTPATRPSIPAPANNNPITKPAAPPPKTSTAASLPPAAPSAGQRQEVADALDSWANAVSSGSLDAYIAHYADTLAVYYNKRNLSVSAVWADKARAFNNYTRMEVTLSNVDINVQSDTATAYLDKAWRFELPDGRTHSGKVQQQIWLERIGDTWLVTGEKDLKLYYKN